MKIHICRSSGHNLYYRVVDSGYKRLKCFMNQIHTTSDRLMFSLHKAKGEGHHNMTLLRESGWNDL